MPPPEARSHSPSSSPASAASASASRRAAAAASSRPRSTPVHRGAPRDVHAEFWRARARRRRLRRVRAGSTFFDLLTAGFPCQPFSERGEQAGLACRKGGMYLELVRVLRVCQPKAFLFENVPALATLGGGDGATAGAVLAAMRRRRARRLGARRDARRVQSCAGYRVSWRVLNARRWVAQKRRRLPSSAPQRHQRGDGRLRVARRRAAGAPAGAARRPRAARFGVGRAVRADGGAVGGGAVRGAPSRPAAARPRRRRADAHLELPHRPARLEVCGRRRRRAAALAHAARVQPAHGLSRAFVLPEPTRRARPHGRRGGGAPYRMLGNAVVPPLVRAIGERMVERCSRTR